MELRNPVSRHRGKTGAPDSVRCHFRVASEARSETELPGSLGGDSPLTKIRERLKCVICSSRRVTVAFPGAHQKGRNLNHLFETEAEERLRYRDNQEFQLVITNCRFEPASIVDRYR